MVGAVTEGSAQLREFIEGGKKIIISTVQKFPFILDELGSTHRGRSFAIVIDEAHSSQGGKASGAVNMALSAGGEEQEDVSAPEESRTSSLSERRRYAPPTIEPEKTSAF